MELLMELGGPINLHEYVRMRRHERLNKKKNEGCVILSEKLEIIIAVLSIVKFLHKKRVILRDLKVDNFIFVDGCLKLVDLESLIKIPQGQDFVEDTKFLMTLPYVDPAIYGFIKKNENISDKHCCYIENDIYSVAMLIFYLIYEINFFGKFVEKTILKSSDIEYFDDKNKLNDSIKEILFDFKKSMQILKTNLLQNDERLNLNEMDFFYIGLDNLKVKERINDLIEKCWGFIFDRPNINEILDEIIEIKKIVDEQIKIKKI
jgi:serine/threonine protein kinase